MKILAVCFWLFIAYGTAAAVVRETEPWQWRAFMLMCCYTCMRNAEHEARSKGEPEEGSR